MATKLKNMKLTSVDLVKAGANQEADICLYKSASAPGTDNSPSEREKNIFKRFLNWLRENPAEDGAEADSPLEKTAEHTDPADIYKSAITESLQSIIADDSLSTEDKNAMVAKSIGQYHDKMMELFKADDDDFPEFDYEDYEGDFYEERETADDTGLSDPAPEYDEIEEVNN